MKWGVRRYQNKDGSLTDAGKKHVDDYRKSRSLASETYKQSNKLISSNKKLKRDFGVGSDDPEYVELVAREYGINTKDLSMANANYHRFCKNNRESVKRGRKIVKKLGLE